MQQLTPTTVTIKLKGPLLAAAASGLTRQNRRALALKPDLPDDRGARRSPARLRCEPARTSFAQSSAKDDYRYL